jgi:ubiquinone/menaquinone biosynthesis C-methylase UbiE
MTQPVTAIGSTAGSGIRRRLRVPALGLALFFSPAGLLLSAEDPQPAGTADVCKVLADVRLAEPLREIAAEYRRRAESRVELNFRSESEIDALVEGKQTGCDVVLGMPMTVDGQTAVSRLPGAKTVAWKYPSGEPVYAAVLTEHPAAPGFVRFVGGPTGHRLWSESRAGFTIVSGTSAKAYEWVAENRTKHTYPLTAKRMLAECGGIREGICIDVGCGPGHLDVELAKQSNLRIIGLDVDAEAQPLFEKRIREAGLEDRVSFVRGDAQQMPFADDYADLIVSRGTLIFIRDIKKCLQEVDRVLKPTGVAFLGGRYVYTPQVHKLSTERLRQLVHESGVTGAQVIEGRGQWVKIVGPKAPEAAHQFRGGPHMLAGRFVADYAITEGKCLLICGSDESLQQDLQQGFVDTTDLEITALYPSEKVAGEAEKRIRRAKLSDRITCKVGDIHALPFQEASFDAVAGVGPLLIWGDREKAMREIYRVLRSGGAALVGGRYLHMPPQRKVPSQSLRETAARTGISSIRVVDDMGQWVEIRKGIKDRGVRD